MIGGIISGMTGLVGSILQKQSNEETNYYNYLMHQQQQKQNLQMFMDANNFTRDERLAAQGYNTSERLAAQQYNTNERIAAQMYNTAMWNASNEYNSPAAQAARLRAAGLNPALMINGAGTTAPVQTSPASVSGASSSGGSSAAPPYGQPFQEVNPLDTSAFGQSFLTMAQAFKVLKESKGIEIDNETRDARNRATLDNLIAEKEQKLENKKLTKDQRRKLEYEITGLKIQNMRLQFQQRKDILVENREREIHDKVLRQFEDSHMKAQLDYASQQLANRLAVNKDSREGQLALQQLQVLSTEVEKMVAEKGYINAQTLSENVKRAGISLDNLAKSFSVQQQQLDSKRTDWLREARSRDKGVRVIDNLLYYFGSALGVPVRGLIK